ncbi:heat-inducible transcriptional repressor HrcA [Almyronema epifaneia]|uniref:Heat-inducible transcription repressor HrcA n=1 Tax=Almyronema epifaneia S1 TaxID=2991925 RepID=A0ABW6I9I8_9CYAN
MQVKLKLNARQQHVLWATVRRYVETAEPVGSKSLVKDYDLKVSPATIRNAMGFLEKSGLLYQPHTSAGRIPSDSGYRIYVDELIQPADKIGRKVDRLLHTQLDWEGWSFEALLRGAAQILSTLSGYVTLITLPNANQAVLRHLQLVQVSPAQGLLIVMLDCYGPQSILIQLPDLLGEAATQPERLERELQILSNFLNTHLKGRTLNEVTLLDWSELDQEFQRYAETLRQAVSSLSRRSQAPASTQMMVSGLAEVLRQPEFSESHQVQAIVQLLEEEQKQIWPLIFETEDWQSTDHRVRIWIGSENPIEPMKSCALVAAMYHRDSLPVGSVGILGPTRMMYENAIAVVEAAADYLSAAISQPA